MNRRDFLRSSQLAALFFLRTGSAAGVAEKHKRVPRPRLGINLAGIADWNTELPFVDVFKMSRPWISQRRGARWGGGPPLDLDERGWVRKLSEDCWAETLLCTISGGHYPGGLYTLLYEGEGDFEVRGAGKIVGREPGRLKVQVDSSRGAIFLQLKKTDPARYVRNIRVIMPGFESRYLENPFHPRFLERWRGLACFRFMDWAKTNRSNISRWSDRPTPQDATFSRKGVALEWMVDLCNRLKADAWFCIPHSADDSYVRSFAELVKARLDPKLKIYVEYSNEVWNGIFPQHRYAASEGQKRGFAKKPWEAAWCFTAWRSARIFQIVEEVFGSNDRIVRVLPTQAANPYVSKRICSFRDAYRSADALGVAPYVSLNVSPRSKPPAEEVAGWSVERLLDYVEKVSLPRSINWIERQKEIADKYNLLLVAYEGGQHLAAHGGAENNEKLTALFKAANRHPRMGLIYEAYLEAWRKLGGDLFCHFSSIGRWSKWGCWGLLEYWDEDPAFSPKFKAVMKWAKGLGQAVSEV